MLLDEQPICFFARKFAFVLALAAPAAASGSYLLRTDGTGQAFSGNQAVQNAIDAGRDGDVVFVAPLMSGSSYSHVKILGKAITLMSLPNTSVLLNSGLEVTGLAAGQRAVVSGFRTYNLSIHDNAGAVRVQFVIDSEGSGGYPNQQCPGNPGGFVGTVTNSSDVTFYSCNIIGGEGTPDYYVFDLPGAGGGGGHGLSIQGSNVAAYNCLLQGGLGGESYSCAGPGGTGCSVDGNSFAFFSECAIAGGTGGHSYGFMGGPGGAGGIGLSGSGTVHHVATSFAGAAGGNGFCGQTPCNGPAGPAISFTGMLLAHGYAPTVVFGPALHASSGTWAHVLDGPVGERVYLTGALASAWRWVPAWQSVRTLPFPFFVPVEPVVLTGPAQNAQYGFATLGSLAFRRYGLQALCIDTVGQKVLSNPLELLHLNRAVGPDCNGNGVNDIVDIYEGTAIDANGNLVPDSCPGG